MWSSLIWEEKKTLISSLPRDELDSRPAGLSTFDQHNKKGDSKGNQPTWQAEQQSVICNLISTIGVEWKIVFVRISCFCLWPTGKTGILLTTVRKMSKEGTFWCILLWKVKVSNFLKSMQGFKNYPGISAEIGIWKTETGFPILAQVLGFFSILS